MAAIQPFVWTKNRGGRKGDNGFQTLGETLTFTRVPNVGEYVNIGDDTEGMSADYRVVLVLHAPLKPNGVDAEIYMERVLGAGEIGSEDKRIAKNPPDGSEFPPKKDDET
ncbi:MAG TPA: hypothetical protein VHG72_06750 [Polyangia bacterium]|nr:hypothetical protein [Polyangia bacterium]